MPSTQEIALIKSVVYTLVKWFWVFYEMSLILNIAFQLKGG